MAEETEVVGFNPTDANAILDMLEGVGGVRVEQARQPRTMRMLGTVKTGGLSAGAEGSVWINDPTSSGWATGSTSCPAWTVGASLVAGDTVLLIEVDGRWLALKVCPT
jgi:hypothetical protein